MNLHNYIEYSEDKYGTLRKVNCALHPYAKTTITNCVNCIKCIQGYIDTALPSAIKISKLKIET